MAETKLEATRIGRYEVQARIGCGAQGTVFRAFDPMLEREVAVKVLEPSADAAQANVDLAHHEARAAAQLAHRNIARIFDLGVHCRRPYLVFEYIAGQGLNSLIAERGAMPQREAWALFRPIVAAIEHAHRHGIAHLDLKPHNIQLTAQGEPRVLDFGLARFFIRDGDDEQGQPGTVRYMSPEHFNEHALGPHTDVFALCLILVEMLCGQPAFLVNGWIQMGAMLFRRGVDLTPLVSRNVSDAAIAVIRDGVAIDHRERIADAGKLLRRLDNAWGGNNEHLRVERRAIDFVLRRLQRRGDLPAFPKVVLDVNRVTSEQSTASVKEISTVVLRDTALSARLLRLANSAFHATRVKATSVSDAIARLGLEQVRIAANSMGYFAALSGARSPPLREALLAALTSGLVARHFARIANTQAIEEAMLCGMLFNTGEHLVIHCLVEEYEAICARAARPTHDARLIASREVLGVDYARLGGEVAAGWQLPDEIVAAIGYRALDKDAERDGQLSNEVSASVLPQIAAASNEVCELAGFAAPVEAQDELASIAQHHHEWLGMTPIELNEVLSLAAAKMDRFAAVLGVDAHRSTYLCSLRQWRDESND